MYNIPNKTSLAYDLSVFDVDETAKKKKKRPLFIHMPESAARYGNWFLILFLAGLAVACAAFVISSKVRQNEITSESITVAKQLEIAEKENARLNAELDSLVTPAKVEEYAQTELGLQKAPNSQISRIVINIEKITEVAEAEEEDAFVRINNKLNEFLEFLGFDYNIIS